MGNAIVLEDNALVNLLEEPGNGAAHPYAAALVNAGIKALDLAGPINLVLDNQAGSGNLLSFARALWVGAIASNIESLRCNRAIASMTSRNACGRRQARIKQASGNSQADCKK